MSTGLIRALRWARWSPSEAAALAKRRTRLALRREHLDAAVQMYGRDRDLCAWHCGRMRSLHL
jgi:hypothetical protein